MLHCSSRQIRTRSFTRVFFALLLGGLTGLALPVGAQAPTGDAQFQVNATTIHYHEHQRISHAPDGGFLVVWTQTPNSSIQPDGSQRGVFLRRYDASGVPIGGDTQVNTFTLGHQDRPDVDHDGTGGAVVVWATEHGAGGNTSSSDIAGQRFAADGSALGSELAINTTTAGHQDFPQVAVGSGGDFVAVWENGDPLSGPDLRAQRFDATGAALGGEIVVTSDTSALLDDVAMDASGGWIVSWTSGDGSLDGVFAQRFAVDGSALGGAFPLNAVTAGDQFDAQVAFDSAGGFTAVWTDTPGPGILGRRISGRQFDASGLAVAGEFQVFDNPGYQADAALDMAADGGFVVSWVDGPTGLLPGLDGHSSGIVGRRFDASATPITNPFVINTYTGGPQLRPEISVEDNGDFVALWGLYILDGVPEGVYGRRYGALDDDLIAHWRLDEGEGSKALDSSGRGLDGSLLSGVAWEPGQQGLAGDFSLPFARVRVEDVGVAEQLDLTDALTIALWVRPETVDGTPQALVSKDGNYELEFGKVGADRWDLRLDNVVRYTASTRLEAGVWQHLAVTWDGAQICGYYNGLLDSCAPFAGTLTANDNAVGLASRPFSNSGSTVFNFDGALDEVAIYRRALSATEIADRVLAELTDITPPVRSNLSPLSTFVSGTSTITLAVVTDEAAECRFDTVPGRSFGRMSNVFTILGANLHNATVPIPGDGTYRFYVRCRDTLGNANGDDAVIALGVGSSDLCSGQVADWRLAEGSGCTAGDLTGANDGTLGPACPGNAPTWTTGRDGVTPALAYDGNNDHVVVASPAGLSGLDGITLAAWIQHGPSGIFRSIIDRRDGGTDGFDLYLSPASKAFLRVDSQTLEGHSVVADGQWHHVVGVFDGAELRIYVDGQLDASTAASPTALDVTAPLYLGRHFANTQFPFAGTLDEVVIYDRGLGDVEVLELFNVGTPICGP